MCEVTTIMAIGAGVSMASQAAGAYGQSQNTKKKQQFANAQFADVSSSALESYNRATTQMQKRTQQVQAAGSQAIIDNSKQADAVIGTVRANRAAAGVGGNSVAALLQDFASIESMNNSRIATNLAWNQDQLQDEALGLYANTQSRINSATPQQLENPSMLALLLGFGGTAFSAAGDIAAYNARIPNSTIPAPST